MVAFHLGLHCFLIFLKKNPVLGIKVIPVRLSVCKRTFVYMYVCMYNMNIPDFSNFLLRCLYVSVHVSSYACKRACRHMRLSVYLYVRMHVCRHAFVREVHRCIHTNVRLHTDRCMRFDMNIRTNVRTNGPSNRHTDDYVLIHKMAYSAFKFIKEDFFYLSKQCRPRLNVPCMTFHQGLYCLPVYRWSSIKNENGLMITGYIVNEHACTRAFACLSHAR